LFVSKTLLPFDNLYPARCPPVSTKSSPHQYPLLFELLQNTAHHHPTLPALTYTNQELSYQKLNALSDQFAAALTTLGIKKGDCVALHLPNLPQFVIAYYGILKAGAVLTAISPLHREREVLYQLADSRAGAVVTLDSFVPMVRQVWGQTMLKHAIVTSATDFPSNQFKQQESFHEFQQLLKQASPNPPQPNISTNDLAALQYTGGTTGTPKAAMLTHTNLAANAAAFAQRIKTQPAAEVFLAALPLFHIYGLTTSLNVPILAGAKIVLLPKFTPQTALDAIQRHRVTVFCGVPTMYQTLLASPDVGKYDLGSVRVCISGAAPLPPQIQKQFMATTGGLLAEGYGLTEASPVTHCSLVDVAPKVGSIGLPLDGTEARIVDAETGTRVLGVGETGELTVRGPQVMQGYWRCPNETALSIRDGWLFTGDLAYIDNEGYCYITDRKKDLIKYKGYSVYPRELEDLLYEHPAVHLCAVVGKSESAVGEIPTAFVVLKEGVTVSKADLLGFVNDKVAAYKALRELEFRKDLPLSSAGKVLRRQLKEPSMNVQ
jgi:long-chain acyl-CoA synthetase